MQPDCALRTPAGRQAGFGIVELMVSMGVMIAVTGAIFQMVSSGQNTFRTQPEVAAIHQRLRVAADMIYKDLLSAGAGLYLGAQTGPLSDLMPVIWPHRRGALNPDGALTYEPDRITIIRVPRTRAQTTLAPEHDGDQRGPPALDRVTGLSRPRSPGPTRVISRPACVA